MKELRNSNHIQTGIFAFIWVLMFVIPLIFSWQNGNWEILSKIWLEYIMLFMLFLINHYLLLPKLFFKEKKGAYTLAALGLVLIFFMAFYMLHYIHHNFSSVPPHPHATPPAVPGFANLLMLAFLVLGFDLGLSNYFRGLSKEQDRIRLEKENVDNKLAFLQNQISPHFFMNTLNNIHALVDIDKEEAKEALIRLSKLMSHLLYESKDNRIAVNKELQFIRSYVELMRLRFTEKVDIKLDIDKNVPDEQIAPLLFISFIENAFKHGVSYQEKSFIHIRMAFAEDQLMFSIRNSNHAQPANGEHSGVGIENTRTRLELLYLEKHSLLIDQQKDTFTVLLELPYD